MDKRFRLLEKCLWLFLCYSQSSFLCLADSLYLEFSGTPSDGQVLAFNSSTGRWEPDTVSGGGGSHGDGANCSAGQYPLGVDANGAVQNCTTDAVNDSVDSSELDNLCATNGKLLQRAAGAWACADPTVDTNANTICSGTATYLDGEGNCDDISAIYAAISHSHSIANVTSLQASLDAKAPLASPTFTGTVILPASQVVNGVTLSTAQGTSNFLRGDGTYATPSGGGSDHGALTGLADDDHSQYHNDARGDARYYLQGQVDSWFAAKATQTEVETARGDAPTLTARISTISNFASPNAGGVVAGRFYDNSFQGTASSTLAGAANRMDLAPFYTSVPLAIDQIGVAVSTAVAASNVKVVIYSTGSDGWPEDLLYETANLSCATTGYKSESLTFSFNSGTMYWVGVRHSSTATLRTINVSSAVNLGLTGSTATTYANVLRSTVTFANAAPDPYTFAASQLTAATPPSIRFRAN